jgi:hypothetical protein
VTQTLQDLDGVVSCAWSPLTRGLLVLYPRHASAQTLLEAVRDASGGGAAVDAPPETPDALRSGHSTARRRGDDGARDQSRAG